MTISEPPTWSERFGAILTVDLAALIENFHTLRRASGNAVAAGVVKADAYGIGLAPAVTALRDTGCDCFFTATLDEALKVREITASARIFVLCGVFPNTEEYFLNNDLIPVLNSLDQVKSWAALSTDRPPAPAALHLDTGMNRLGLSPGDVPQLAEDPDLLKNLNLVLVMSHLANANDPAEAANAAQRDLFDSLANSLPAAPRSLANSGGIYLGPGYHYQLTRPGISLYGGAPFPGQTCQGQGQDLAKNPIRPVVQLSGRIVQLRDIAKGDPVGYGATYRAPAPRRLATVALGYADGYLRRFSQENGPDMPIAGRIGPHRTPVVGRVSMDLTVFDVTGVPDDAVYPGGLIDLFGGGIDIDNLAAASGTISNELLTSLGQRYYRHYLPVSPTSGVDASQNKNQTHA